MFRKDDLIFLMGGVDITEQVDRSAIANVLAQAKCQHALFSDAFSYANTEDLLAINAIYAQRRILCAQGKNN